VTLDTEFREVDDLVARLRECDLLVFPYQGSQESASGAVRMALAARRPVLCTPLAIFDDIKPLVHFAKGFDALALGDKIMELYWNQKQLHEHDALRDHYLDTHSFSSLARALLRIIEMQPPLAQVPLEEGAVA
jgi:glycosyltransferase involved in cell wall biosynthesis